MSSFKFIYLTTEMAIDKHNLIIGVSGGFPGITDEKRKQLDSILEFVKNDNYYEGIVEKVVYLIYAIVKDHIFLDGNKRTAIAISSYFLELNGFSPCVPRFIQEMENYVVWLVEDRISRSDLENKIAFIVMNLPETEEFKLDIIMKLQKSLDI